MTDLITIVFSVVFLQQTFNSSREHDVVDISRETHLLCVKTALKIVPREAGAHNTYPTASPPSSFPPSSSPSSSSRI